MHPAYSVIFFTVSSGAGFGLLALMGLAPLIGLGGGIVHWGGFVLGFALAVAGLLSSTRHLGHPERAWRALTQWRSSWLSREGVLAILALGVSGLYALLILFFGMSVIPLGIVSCGLCIATVYATAMIYASLRTVQRWNQPLTIACYLGFAITSGAMLLAFLSALSSGVWNAGGLIALLAAFAVIWFLKMEWWREGDAATPLSTPESATGLGHLGRVRLLESPHSGENYLQREMGFRIARRHAQKLRRMALLLGAGVPLAFVLIATVLPAPALWLALAVIGHLAGLLVERWLFFAEAEHAVMTYYDRGEARRA